MNDLAIVAIEALAVISIATLLFYAVFDLFLPHGLYQALTLRLAIRHCSIGVLTTNLTCEDKV